MPRKKKNLKWQKIKNTSISAGCFLCNKLLELGELYLQPFEKHYYYERRPQEWPREISSCRLRQEIRRMKERGWIVEAEKHGKKFLQLTRKGKLEALHKKLRTIKQPPKNAWDNKWRLAIFDIPEKGRRERDTIRETLKAVGFFQLQKSVYVYPFEIPGETIAYLKTSGLLPFIRFARIDKMDDTKDLRKYFKL